MDIYNLTTADTVTKPNSVDQACQLYWSLYESLPVELIPEPVINFMMINCGLM